jgi:hypothetical protein
MIASCKHHHSNAKLHRTTYSMQYVTRNMQACNVHLAQDAMSAMQCCRRFALAPPHRVTSVACAKQRCPTLHRGARPRHGPVRLLLLSQWGCCLMFPCMLCS